jgi:hypothetical protein
MLDLHFDRSRTQSVLLDVILVAHDYYGVIIINDRFCGLVVRVSGYRY